MNSIRVHSSTPGNPVATPYLVLSLVGPGRLGLDFAPLGEDFGVTSLTLSEDALYDVLMGKDLVVSLPEAGLVFVACGEELVISVRVDSRPAPVEFRVWLAEMALGWNVLSRAANPRI